MNKFLAKVLVLISFLSLAYPYIPVAKAGIVPGSVDIPTLDDLKSDTTNLFFHGNYRYYPKSVEKNDGSIVDVRAKKDATNYKTLPWLAYKEGVISNTLANTLTSTAPAGCTNRYCDGGVSAASNGWVPPSAYANWALPSDSTMEGVSPYAGVVWQKVVSQLVRPAASIATPYEGGSVYPLQLGNVNGDATIGAISGVSTLTTTDSAVTLFQGNGYSSYTNYAGERLLSNGISYFRKEFDIVSLDQLNTIDKFDFWAQGDDFFKVYLNGTEITYRETSPSELVVDSTGPIYIKEDGVVRRKRVTNSDTYVSLSKQDLSGILKVGKNVLAIQLIDKATWSGVYPSNSNATGIKYLGRFAQSYTPPPTCSCDVLPTSGTAPLSVEVSVISNLTGPWTVTGTGPTTVTKTGVPPVYFNLTTPGSYAFSIAQGATSCGCSNTTNVKQPTDGSGNETNP